MIKRTAIYPGTFDPITNGHMDVIAGAMKICDHLIIGVAEDMSKTPIFSVEERVEMVLADAKNMGYGDNISVISFKGLLVDFARQKDAMLLIRGLRAVSDFEYEFQLAAMNSRLASDIQTVFIPASGKHQFVASKLVKEVARLEGDISPFVSENVSRKLYNYFK